MKCRTTLEWTDFIFHLLPRRKNNSPKPLQQRTESWRALNDRRLTAVAVNENVPLLTLGSWPSQQRVFYRNEAIGRPLKNPRRVGQVWSSTCSFTSCTVILRPHNNGSEKKVKVHPSSDNNSQYGRFLPFLFLWNEMAINHIQEKLPTPSDVKVTWTVSVFSTNIFLNSKGKIK